MPTITLVPMTSADADEILAGEPVRRRWAEGYPTEGDVEVAGWLASGAMPPVTAEAPFGPWLVVTDAGLVVGGVGFHGHPDAQGRVEIGYGIAAPFRGQGIASAAVAHLCVMPALRAVTALVAHTDPDNSASQRVLERNGFARDGMDEQGIRWQLPVVDGEAARSSG
jgi:RimJ/RimL family protein N-acetyltransferase